MRKFKKGDVVDIGSCPRYFFGGLLGTIASGKHGWWIVRLHKPGTAQCAAYRWWELTKFESSR